jgi:hypothetical protein
MLLPLLGACILSFASMAANNSVSTEAGQAALSEQIATIEPYLSEFGINWASPTASERNITNLMVRGFTAAKAFDRANGVLDGLLRKLVSVQRAHYNQLSTAEQEKFNGLQKVMGANFEECAEHEVSFTHA